MADVRTVLDVVRLSTSYLGDRGSDSARLDAELLCAHALGLRRIDLYLQFDRPLDGDELTAIRELVRRRGHGEPVAYLTGEREFHGRAFGVSADVLVPRPETETLVDCALRRLGEIPAGFPLRVADLGTGSGCIAVTLAASLSGLEVFATDASEAALGIARQNALRHGVEVTFVGCSWADGLDGWFDVVVSNPPYVTTAEIDETAADVRDFEPRSALVGGADGLDAYRALLASLTSQVRASRLLLEVDPRRAAAVVTLIGDAYPGARCAVIDDLTGRARVVDASVVAP